MQGHAVPGLKGPVYVVPAPLHALYDHALGEPVGLAGAQVQGEGGFIFVQPTGSGDAEGQVPAVREIAALQLDCLSAAVSDARPFIAVPQTVHGVAAQPFEQGGVVRVLRQGELHAGGVDGERFQADTLAVQLHPLVQSDAPARAQQIGVNGQAEGKGSQGGGQMAGLGVVPGTAGRCGGGRCGDGGG